MTIYYTLTFMLLSAEMVTFCLLVAPLPYAVRKRLFMFLSESPIVAKIAYGLKISFIFVGVLFVGESSYIGYGFEEFTYSPLDAVQRMLRVTSETEMAKSGGHGMQDVRTETNFAARKFYAQRNTYLTGFCLFLSMILTRTFYIILDLIHTQGEYAKLKQATSSQSRKNIASQDQSKVITELKAKLASVEAKDRDFETLKKQSSQQAAEYDRLATEFNEATGAVSDKRVD